MNRKKSLKVIKIILIILTLLTLAVIWGHSMVPPEGSTEESTFFKGIFDGFLKEASGNDSLSVPEVLIRKSAHFTEYAVLGAELAVLYLLFFSASEYFRYLQLFLNTFLFAAFTAMTDESIQYFSGRYSSVFDVWLDCIGAASAILIISLISKMILKKHKKKN